MEPGYFPYYCRAIDQHSEGLKLVLGGTGLGKTSAIPEVVRAPQHQDRKFIYLANRRQLLEAMADELAPGECVYVRRDLETVQRTLRDQHAAFHELIDSKLFLDHVARANQRYPHAHIDLPAVRRACKTLEDLGESGSGQYLELIEEQIEGLARLILRMFRFVLLAANDRSGEAPVYCRFADHPVVQSLFPCIAFTRRDDARIMLITLQKAFYGFFDGRETLNLSRLQDDKGGYVIFLDEFDFLEHDLVDLICRSPQISDPFRFVEHFYRAMRRHKLPLATYPETYTIPNHVRQRIDAIIEVIDRLRAEGPRFPDINQFTSSIPQLSPAVFRTRHTMSTDSLYIRETERSFHVIRRDSAEQEAAFPALRLFGAIGAATERILTLFKELEKDDEILYREMLRHCFQDTVYPEQMALIASFPRRGQTQRTQLGVLLDAGYSLYDIEYLRQRTDPEEVAVRHYSMRSTPETLLLALAQHNLVFGLSATADMPRIVHNFDLEWLRQQGVRILEVEEEDKRLIGRLNAAKAQRRGNRISVAQITGLDADDPYQHRLSEFLAAVVAVDEDFGDDTRTGVLRRRVQHFFATLLWMSAHASERDTLLLFLNTFRQVKLVFDRYRSPENALFTITLRADQGGRAFDVYEIDLQGRRFMVVFYNADLANAMRQSPEAQAAYNQVFWQGLPVIVVTQYLSAGNGVNLQFTPAEDAGRQTDFTHIGLLEAPYFYFGKPDPEQTAEERLAMLKENIWYQAKLFANKAISETRFKQRLSALHASHAWNVLYQQDPSTAAEALLNQMSALMQALGRVERVWEAMPDQVALFSPEVYERFHLFCSAPFAPLRERREPIISNNLRQIFAQIADEIPVTERETRRSKDSTLQARNARCRDAIGSLVRRLETVRSGDRGVEATRDVRQRWEDLRRAALQHDFGHPLLEEYACVAESPYYADGILYVTPDLEVVPPQLGRLAQLDAAPWRMDRVYDIVAENTVICQRFIEEGYELAFNRTSQQFFTPYCYQALLTGAVGEEAIRAILAHEGIALEDLPDALFEVADLKVRDLPWYIDCKDYSETTLERFSVPEDDPTWHPTLNDRHFEQRAKDKIRRIAAAHRGAGKLIYVNLVSSQERPHDYYSRDFVRVKRLEDAEIIVVQGCLQGHASNAYQQAFEYFLADVRRVMAAELQPDHQPENRPGQQPGNQPEGAVEL